MKISFIYALILSTFLIFFYLDFDECKDERFNSCREYAYCTNIDGSYICNCFEGFFGDGKKCQGMLLLTVIIILLYMFLFKTLDYRILHSIIISLYLLRNITRMKKYNQPLKSFVFLRNYHHITLPSCPYQECYLKQFLGITDI